MSLYSTHQGYMGRSGLFIYDSVYDNSFSYKNQNSVPSEGINYSIVDDCKIFTEPTVYNYNHISLKPLNISVSTFSEFFKTDSHTDLYNVINLTTNTINNTEPNLKYSLKIGFYIISCPNSYIALLNYGKTNSITYEGINLINTNGPDTHMYSYYKDIILIRVLDNFGYLTLHIKDENFRGHNILSYSN